MEQSIGLQIERKIYFLRGFKVMLDSELADLYGIEAKVLNQAVKRNIKRFPDDFMFQPNSHELTELRSQIVTLQGLTSEFYFRHTPFVFTENGIAMLSSVLHSDRAIEVNIAIMRIFTKLRSFLVLETELRKDMNDLKEGTGKMFQIVFERMDSLEESVIPKLNPRRKKIGLKD